MLGTMGFHGITETTTCSFFPFRLLRTVNVKTFLTLKPSTYFYSSQRRFRQIWQAMDEEMQEVYFPFEIL